jgi:hypothetical protein
MVPRSLLLCAPRIAGIALPAYVPGGSQGAPAPDLCQGRPPLSPGGLLHPATRRCARHGRVLIAPSSACWGPGVPRGHHCAPPSFAHFCPQIVQDRELLAAVVALLGNPNALIAEDAMVLLSNIT